MVSGYPLQMLFFKRKIFYEKGARRIPKGGALIISNHYNLFDYVHNAFLVFPRRLNPIASEDPFKRPFFRWGMKFFGAIEANRISKNMKFVDRAAEVIKKGQLVQIFPEGRNTPDGNIHQFKHSYLVIAYRSSAPIIPIITDGNYSPLKRVSVMVGAPIDVSGFFTGGGRTPSREELSSANDFVYKKVLELRCELEERKKKSEK